MERRRVRTLERFPFCVDPVGFGAGAITVPTMDYAMKWWWRVRKWRFTHTLTYGGTPFAAPSVDFFAHDTSFLIGGQSPPSIESGLECPQPGIATEQTDVGPPAWIWDLSALGGVSNDGVLVRVSFGISFHVDDANDLRGPGPGAEDDSTAGAVTMLFDGVAVPLFIGASSAPWVGTIDFTPIEFWPYPLPDGSEPIWDATTGAQLLPTNQTRIT